MIIDHTDERYIKRRDSIGLHRYNGAYYYSKEIVKNIIPNVKTDRHWITVKVPGEGFDHSILFVHDNVDFERTYEYMLQYDDVLYVVGLPDMIEIAEKYGRTIYIPLSVDIEYVETFKREKDRGTAFAGRDEWRGGLHFPQETDFVEMLPREQFLSEMARYENIYAVSRAAIEAKILGCNVLPFHPRFPDPELFKVIDNKDAAKLLQRELDAIDGATK